MAHDANKQQVAENIWLHYFNQELYKRSIITELERNKIALRIEGRKLPSQAKKSISR